MYPADFLWGTATAAYQVEGGINAAVAGSPQNNWAAWERGGRADPTGDGCGFWTRWEADLDRAAGLGLTAFRFGLEWARLEPADGGWDDAAVRRYAAIAAGCRRRGMRPLVTLQHFSHPEWLGSDPWLDAEVPTRFGRYCAEAARRLGEVRGAAHGAAPVDFWITLNEPNALATATYQLGAFPRGEGRGGRRDWARAMGNLLRAHVFGWRAVHDVYVQHGWPEPLVTYNAWAGAAYGHDRRWLDALRPATRGRDRELRRRWYRELPGADIADKVVHGIIDRWMLPAEATEPLTAELGADEDPLDALAIDFYDPFVADYALSWRGPRRHPWDWLDRSAIMAPFVKAYTAPHRDKPLYVLEHGIAVRDTPFRNGAHRRDGLRRPDVIQGAAAALDALVSDEDAPKMGGYCHWSLLDNYEWGSWRARFGLFGVDFDDGAARSSHDAAGDDAAGAYAAVIAARRPTG